MSIALDVGVSQMRSLRRRRFRLVGRNCRSSYAALPDSPIRRRVLDEERVSYAVCEDSLIMLGDLVSEFAQLFHVPSVPLLLAGDVPHDDPPARQAIAAIIDAILPEPQAPKEHCCLSISGLPDRRSPAGHESLDFLTQVVRLRGYVPSILSSTRAVVLAELVGDAFSGIGMSFGAGSCEIGLVHCGLEIARCTVPVGGNWIDEQLARRDASYFWDSAGHKYLNTDAATAWKEAFAGSLLELTSAREWVLCELYQDLITRALTEACQTFSAVPEVADVPQPVSVVCSGGATSISGFCELLTRSIQKTPLPVAVKQVTVAELYSEMPSLNRVA